MVNYLIVGVRWPPETFIQRKIKGLCLRGVRVAVAASSPRPPKSRSLAKVLWIPHWRAPNVVVLLWTFIYALKLLMTSPARLVKVAFLAWQESRNVKRAYAKFRAWVCVVGENPDVVHFEWNSAAIDYLPLFDIWKCPVTISCRGRQINVRPHVPGNDQFVVGLRETFRRAAAVHCVSEAIKREAIQYGLDPAKAWVIRPAVDPDFFFPAEKQTEKRVFRVVTTGSLIWHKGYEYALVAVRQLVDAGIPAQFDIIGDGPERQRVLYTIHDLGLENQVRLLGRLPPEQVRDHLQQADVFLLSSLSEGISNAVLEAMACGLPVVTTDCGGMREAVTDGVEGFVVPVRDSEAMAIALMRLWEDKELRQRIGNNARKRVLKEFTLKNHIEQWRALITAVCQE